MNGNGVGATTLAYLRGEKDLFQEREGFAQVKKQLEEKGVGIGLSVAQKRRMERFWKVATLLHENSRMSLTEMSRKAKVPVSTLFDTLKEVEKYFRFTIVSRESEKDVSARDPLTFKFGYQVSMDADAGDKAQRVQNLE